MVFFGFGEIFMLVSSLGSYIEEPTFCCVLKDSVTCLLLCFWSVHLLAVKDILLAPCCYTGEQRNLRSLFSLLTF